MFVPVIDINQRPLMPTSPARARRWIESGKATPFWKRGIFCVRLNVEPSERNTQPIAVGVDPGSKREGYTVKSQTHTYLNVQTHTVDWVKDHVEVRRSMRRARRFRNTPCRQNRKNRLVNKQKLPPSTKARWQWKLRICKWLTLMFPVSTFVVEDIKAKTWKGARRPKACDKTKSPQLLESNSRRTATHSFLKSAPSNAFRRATQELLGSGVRKWNSMFSPLEVGKQWFYSELRSLANLQTRTGNDTYEMRQELGLKKSKNKLSNSFSAHCVDSWVLANWSVGGHERPDNTRLIEIIPLEFHRRQLHRLQHAVGSVRARYGGTISDGLKRGSLVKHVKYGLVYVGGYMEKPTKKEPSRKVISLHDISTGKRITQNALKDDCKFLTYNTWRIQHAA